MLIQVVPSTVTTYSTRANGQFEIIQGHLRRIIVSCVGVEYNGENAVLFKNETGDLASAFAKQINGSLSGMVTAVNASMSGIAGSLGGTPPIVAFTAQSTVTPEPVTLQNDLYDVDTDGLTDLKRVLADCFMVVTNTLIDHRASLEGTTWVGNAKTMAVAQVGGLTTKATGDCNNYLSQLSAKIDQQVEATKAADNRSVA